MSDLRNKLIRLAYRKPELRRDLLPLIKTAAEEMDIWAYVHDDGYLIAAADEKSNARYFDPAGENQDEAKVVHLKKVPSDLAKEILNIGTSKQSHSDGYEAWDDVKKYAK